MAEMTDPTQDALDTLEAFSRDLKALQGIRTFKDLSAKAGYSVGILHSATKGTKLPTEPVLLAFVGACGGDQAAWKRRRALLADAGSGTDKELSRAHAEIGRLGDELERLRQVVDDPETSAYRAERRLADAQAAEARASKDLHQLGTFAEGLRAQIVAAADEAAKVRKEAADEAASQKADLVARGAAAARTAEKIISEAEALRESAATDAARIRARADADAERIREDARAEVAHVVSEARETAIAEARTLVLSEVDRQRDLAVRTAHELINAASTEAQAVETEDEPPQTEAMNSPPEITALEEARQLAEAIVERAKFQADTIRRVAIQDSAALQAKHAQLLADVESLERRRAAHVADPPNQSLPSTGRHRRRASNSPMPAQRPAPPPELAPETALDQRRQAEGLVRQLELSLPKYMKELAQARRSHDLAKVRVAEGALERCRSSLVDARAALDRIHQQRVQSS